MKHAIVCAIALALVAVGAGGMYTYRTYYPLAAPAQPAELVATAEQSRTLQRHLTLSRAEQAQHAQTIFNTVVAGIEQLRKEVADLKTQKEAIEEKVANCGTPTAAMQARMDAIERRLPKMKRAPPRLAPWDVRVLFAR